MSLLSLEVVICCKDLKKIPDDVFYLISNAERIWSENIFFGLKNILIVYKTSVNKR